MSEKAKKFDSGKIDLSYIEPAMVRAIAEAMEFGAKKYGRHNYRKGGFTNMRLVASLLRHLMSYLEGEDDDQESGLPHLSHAAANIQMLIVLTKDGTLIDDRYRSKGEDDNLAEISEVWDNIR